MTKAAAFDTGLIARLKDIVGPKGWRSDGESLEPHVTEWRGLVRGETPIMVLPASVEEVAAVVRACAEKQVGIVPQGGNTGMCAGAVPDASGRQVLLNLARMNRIRRLDAADFSLVADAGCILADLQSAARDAGRFLPLSHGGEGSCQIGGNVATNAGGINVLRYGTARDLVLGLEVVLADGTVWNGLRTLRKNTAGYDVKQLFIGSEGTLGIITAAALELVSVPAEPVTIMAGVADAADAVELLGRLREQAGDRLLAFELIGDNAFECVWRHIPDTKSPLDSEWPWYVLVDIESDHGTAAVEDLLADSLERGLVRDAIVAKSVGERDAIWRMRHSISEAEKREGPGVKLDVSVPIARIGEFLAEGAKRLANEVPEAHPVVFGHVGDGNLHYNAILPESGQDEVGELRQRVTALVFGLVGELDGSICAEHGVGLLKKSHLVEFLDPVELGLMRNLKSMLDPGGILNPGKVI